MDTNGFKAKKGFRSLMRALISLGVSIIGLASLILLSGCPSPQPQNTLQQEPLYQSGQALFSNRCAACHGMQGEGTSMLLEGKNIHFNSPAWQKRLSDNDIAQVIKSGRGNMPAFELTPDEEKALIFFIRHLPDNALEQ